MPTSLAALRMAAAHAVAQQAGVDLRTALSAVRRVFARHIDDPVPSSAEDIEDHVLEWVDQAVVTIEKKEHKG